MKTFMDIIVNIFDAAILASGIVTVIVLFSMMTGIFEDAMFKLFRKFPILDYIVPVMMMIGIANAIINM